MHELYNHFNLFSQRSDLSKAPFWLPFFCACVLVPSVLLCRVSLAALMEDIFDGFPGEEEVIDLAAQKVKETFTGRKERSGGLGQGPTWSRHCTGVCSGLVEVSDKEKGE